MAVPQWLKISATEMIAVGPSSISKITLDITAIIITHADGTQTRNQYTDAAIATSAFADYAAIVEAETTGKPAISSVTPSGILQSTLPQNITITGYGFDSTAVIVLRNYAASTALVTVGVPVSTSMVSTVPNTILVGTYDVIYTDSNGNTDVVLNGLVIY